MPRYTILDQQTGKKVTIESDKPPTEKDFESIFKDAGLRNTNTGGIGFINNFLGLNQGGYQTPGLPGRTAAPNPVEQTLLPRESDIQNKVNTGQPVSVDQRIGGAGEALNRIGAPIASLLGIPFSVASGAGGAIEGATKPGASVQDRIVGGAAQGAGQYVTAKGAEILNDKVLKPILKPVGAMVKNSTPGIAGKNWQAAAEKATSEGASVKWDKGENNLMDQIKNEVQKKLGWDVRVRDATNNFLAGRTPVPPTVTGSNGLPMIGDTALQANDLGGMRTAIKNEYGKDIFGNAVTRGVGGLDMKVASIARNVVSKNLHKIAPETLPPDIAMSIYHKAGVFGKLGLPGLIGEAIAGQYAARKVGVPILKLLGLGG